MRNYIKKYYRILTKIIFNLSFERETEIINPADYTTKIN